MVGHRTAYLHNGWVPGIEFLDKGVYSSNLCISVFNDPNLIKCLNKAFERNLSGEGGFSREEFEDKKVYDFMFERYSRGFHGLQLKLRSRGRPRIFDRFRAIKKDDLEEVSYIVCNTLSDGRSVVDIEGKSRNVRVLRGHHDYMSSLKGVDNFVLGNENVLYRDSNSEIVGIALSMHVYLPQSVC